MEGLGESSRMPLGPWGSRGWWVLPFRELGEQSQPPPFHAPPTQALLELTELLSAHNNYARYRRAWAGCTAFRLPVLGVHLKDLVALNEAQPDRLPDGRLHLPKLNSLYLRLQELAALQRQEPPGSASEDLLHLLTVSCPELPRLSSRDCTCRALRFRVLVDEGQDRIVE